MNTYAILFAIFTPSWASFEFSIWFQGDSGAGLVVRNGGKLELVGIMSAGIACGRPLKPGVYTRISEYRDWITDHMQ